jgi:quercetin dioxygenase-like cupin family protein
MATTSTIAGAEALKINDLITPTPQGIASRILSKNKGGSVTLFAFDTGQGLSEHTAPFDALVMVLEGTFTLTIGGQPVTAPAGTVVLMPADIPHAVDATEPSRMVLTMLREPKAA